MLGTITTPPPSLCVTLVGHSEQGSADRSQRGPQLGRGILTMMTLNRSRFPPLFALGSLLFLKSVCTFSPVSGFSHQEGLRRCSGFQATAKLTLRLNFPRELEACLTFNYLSLLHHLAYGEDSRRFRLAAFLPTNRLPLHWSHHLSRFNSTVFDEQYFLWTDNYLEITIN